MNTFLLYFVIYIVTNIVLTPLLTWFMYHLYEPYKSLKENFHTSSFKDELKKLTLENFLLLFFIGSIATVRIIIVYIFSDDKYFDTHTVRCCNDLGHTGRTIYSLGENIYVCFASSYRGEYYTDVIRRIEGKYGTKKGHQLPNSPKNKYIRAVKLLINNDPKHFEENTLKPELLIAKNFPL